MNITEILIDDRSWKLKDHDAITIYPVIFYKRSAFQVDNELRNHEFIHCEQVRRIGWLKFYFRYLIHLIKKTPYREIEVEVEAYDKQGNGKRPWEVE